MTDQRREFEAAMRARKVCIGLRNREGYEDRIVQFAWELWQDACKHESEQHCTYPVGDCICVRDGSK